MKTDVRYIGCDWEFPYALKKKVNDVLVAQDTTNYSFQLTLRASESPTHAVNQFIAGNAVGNEPLFGTGRFFVAKEVNINFAPGIYIATVYMVNPGGKREKITNPPFRVEVKE